MISASGTFCVDSDQSRRMQWSHFTSRKFIFLHGYFYLGQKLKNQVKTPPWVVCVHIQLFGHRQIEMYVINDDLEGICILRAGFSYC